MTCPNCKSVCDWYKGFYCKELGKSIDYCKSCDPGHRPEAMYSSHLQTLYDGSEKVVISPAYRREIETRYVHPDGSSGHLSDTTRMHSIPRS